MASSSSGAGATTVPSLKNVQPSVCTSSLAAMTTSVQNIDAQIAVQRGQISANEAQLDGANAALVFALLRLSLGLFCWTVRRVNSR
jgi:hypothetical protein